MTLPRISDLSDETVRVMMAEAVGWIQWTDEESGILGGDWSKTIWTPPGKHDLGNAHANPPNYPASLDAVAPVLATLHGKAHPSAVTDEERAFRDALAKIRGCAWYQSANLLFSTARQHCDAFLVATGKATL